MKISDAVEAILAVIIIGAIAFIATYESINGKPISVPPELYGFGGIVLGSYFRGRSVNGTIASLTSALQASVPASAVNVNVPAPTNVP